MARITVAPAAITGAIQGTSDATAMSQLVVYLPPLLSVVAGMVDVLSFLRLGNVFTAHVTGNLVLVAASLARGGPWSAAQVATMPVFVAALSAMLAFARVSRSRGVRLAYQLLVLQLALLTVVFLINVVVHPSLHPHDWLAVTTAMIAVFAMASQYAVFRLALPRAVSTAAMTGNLTNTALSLADKLSNALPIIQNDDERLKQSSRLLIGFFLGCVVAAAVIPLLGDWAWLLPVLLAAVVVALTAAYSRSTSNTRRK